MGAAVFLFWLLCVGWLVAYHLRLSAARSEALDEAARRLGEGAAPSRSPAGLSYELGGVRAELTLPVLGRDGATELRLDWRPAQGWLRVWTEGRVGRSVLQAVQVRPLSLGDRAFEEVFFVQGEPQAWVRERLGPAARTILLSLVRLGRAAWGREGVRLTADGEGVTLRSERVLHDPEALWSFLERGATLLAELQGDPQLQRAGARLALSARSSAAGRCPVCSDALEPAQARACSACGTGHHPECWDYLGGCAVIGCAAFRRRDLAREGDRGQEW
ncbi:MAG: RING finger protein [Planctomycetota bacterium]